MGRIPDLKRITVEDFPQDEQALVGKIAFVVNSFHEQVRSALNGNIDSTNLAQEIKQLDFTTGPNGQPLNTLNFRSGLRSNIVGINVIRLQITSENQRYPLNVPLISFTQNDGLVTINNITGLEANLSYRMTLQTIT